MSETFFTGSKVRLYEGPAFYRVRPKVSPLVHGETYVVTETKFDPRCGEQLVRVHLPTGGKSDWVEATWLCRV